MNNVNSFIREVQKKAKDKKTRIIKRIVKTEAGFSRMKGIKLFTEKQKRVSFGSEK